MLSWYAIVCFYLFGALSTWRLIWFVNDVFVSKTTTYKLTPTGLEKWSYRSKLVLSLPYSDIEDIEVGGRHLISGMRIKWSGTLSSRRVIRLTLSHSAWRIIITPPDVDLFAAKLRKAHQESVGAHTDLDARC